ncbi:MAG TPA: ArsA family ATPase [Blastocatellia bacterium]
MTKRSAKASVQSTAAGIPSQRVLLFGGKGGVGKTTAACATALELLKGSKPDEHILLMSTDPAHSLSDALGSKVGNRLVRVAGRLGRGRLFAYEVDAETALDSFKKKYGARLAEIFERGTFLDKEDIDHLMGLSFPGIDEVMCLLELSRFIQSGEYSRIVVDTAPTGHTLRLLQLPAVFAGWLGALDAMSEKHRFMVLQLTRKAGSDEVDRFLEDFTTQTDALRSVLSDSRQSAFVMVTIPEVVAFEETRRYFKSLAENHINVSHFIINRIEEGKSTCAYCKARAKSQRPVLERLKSEFGDVAMKKIPVVPAELTGPEALVHFGELMWTGRTAKARALSTPANIQTPPANQSAPRPAKDARFPLESWKWLIFGGKGGVGKTTASCSMALALAESDPKRRIVVFSSDPAHSLSDSFGEHIGESKKGVAGRDNLDGIEIDPGLRFAKIKDEFNNFLDEAFNPGGSSSVWTLEFDPDAMRGFLNAAPPGIDEIMALTAVGDLIASGAYDTIVVDSAPTGHLLRFLELPEVALSWIRTLMKLLLKYKDLVRWNALAEELLQLSKNIRSTVSLMTDANQTEFIGVATPELMSLDETRRLAASLARLKVPMRRLLINNVIPESTGACEICESRLRRQAEYIGKFKRVFSRQAELFTAPQQPASIQGPELLKLHFSNWQKLT